MAVVKKRAQKQRRTTCSSLVDMPNPSNLSQLLFTLINAVFSLICLLILFKQLHCHWRELEGSSVPKVPARCMEREKNGGTGQWIGKELTNSMAF